MTSPQDGYGNQPPTPSGQPLPPQPPGPGAAPYQHAPSGFGPFGTGIPPEFVPRALAVIIDAVLALCVSLPLIILIIAAIILGQTVSSVLGIVLGLAAAAVFVALMAFWIYIYIVVVGRDGQTPGKRMQGIRIVKVDGQPLGSGGAFLRWLIASLMNNVVGIPLGSFWMLFDPEKRTLYDKVLNYQAITVEKGSLWPLIQPSPER